MAVSEHNPNKCAKCDNEPDILYIPCGHKTLCRQCCDAQARCPLCGSPARWKVQEREGIAGTTFVLASICFLGFFAGLSLLVILGAIYGFLGISLRSAIGLTVVFSLFWSIAVGFCWKLKRVSRQIPMPMGAREDLP